MSTTRTTTTEQGLSLEAIKAVKKVIVEDDDIDLAQFVGDPTDVTCRQLDGMDAFVFDNVLSEEECRYLVRRTEELGYTFWDAREDARKDFRNADTIEVVRRDIATIVWDRLAPFVDKSLTITEDQPRWQCDMDGEWEPFNTNEHLLFARYKSGGHFAPHTDGYNIVNFNTRSLYTLIIYLNTCAKGGQTRFYSEEVRDKLFLDEQGRYSGAPEYATTHVDAVRGRALIFFQDLMHEGVAVGEDAEKYIIRSDVMYRRVHPYCNSPKDIEAFKLYQLAEEISNTSNDPAEIERSTRLFRQCFKMSPALADVFGM